MMYRWDGETNDNQTRVDDTDPAVTYEGAWETQTISPAKPSFVSTHNSTLHETSTAEACAKYSFSGSSIALRGRRMFDHGGTADVFIDGTFQQTVSYSYLSGGDWRVIFSKTGLDPGMHTIEVVCKGGGSINVDAFQYTTASAQLLLLITSLSRRSAIPGRLYIPSALVASSSCSKPNTEGFRLIRCAKVDLKNNRSLGEP